MSLEGCVPGELGSSALEDSQDAGAGTSVPSEPRGDGVKPLWVVEQRHVEWAPVDGDTL